MLQALYVSKTSQPMSAEQLLSLLLQCRTNNQACGVTGMLLYSGGTFLQAIEGEEEVIEDLLEKILADPRHDNVQLLSKKTVDARQYADWSMGFEEVSDEALGKIEGLRGFSIKDFNFDYLVGNIPVVDTLMQYYREPHWDQVLGELDAKDRVIEHLRTALAQMRDRAEIARLALESVTEASRKGKPDDALLQLCDAALESMRPR
jgi:hypothetical protein